MSDEGFREIQLNGKQLTFVVMAATVVLVVTFLFGVLVGRNAPRGSETVASTEIAPDPAVPPMAENVAPASPAGVPSSDAAATKPAEQLSYADRLLRDNPPEENLKPASPAPARQAASPPREAPTPPRETAATPPARETAAPSRETAAAARETSGPSREAPAPSREKTAAVAPVPQEPVATPPAPRPAPATVPPAPADGADAKATQPSDPSGPGFAVQVAAYRDRRESDSLAKQLIAKGYPAFVLDPVKGAPTALFRVRVGKYKTLKDAQAIMAQLQTAEQFNTAWIAR